MKNYTKSMVISGLVALSLSTSVFLSGCAGASREQKQTIAGSVIGGALGHQFGKGKGKQTMAIIGAVAGGMIGGANARRMDQEDQQRVSQSLETAPNYRKVAWENPETKTNYEFTPVNTYEGNVNGRATTCRDYVMDAYIDGRMQQVNGRACKNSNGQWVNTN